MFAAQLSEASGDTVVPEGFLPDTPAKRYLQLKHTVPHDNFDDALAVDDAGDGSAWSAAHARYHDFFRELTTRYDYEDVMLVDKDGDIVHTAYKGVDLGTNIRTGQYAGGNLQEATDAAIQSNAVDFVAITDCERY